MEDKTRKYAIMERALDEWYSEDQSRQNVLNGILSGKIGVSLRTIDWFTTNMAARSSVVFVHPNTGKVVDVNGFYKDSLKCFHKRGFDPFKRRGADPSEASLRQKNFFKWAIENGVIDYILKNISSIERDMACVKNTKRSCCRRHRCFLKKSIASYCYHYPSPLPTKKPLSRRQSQTPPSALMIPSAHTLATPSYQSPSPFSSCRITPIQSSCHKATPYSFSPTITPSMFILSQKTTLEIPKYVKLDW